MLLLLLAAGADPTVEVHLTRYDSAALRFRRMLAAGAKAADLAQAKADMEVRRVGQPCVHRSYQHQKIWLMTVMQCC
jgi:hypothetical protein